MRPTTLSSKKKGLSEDIGEPIGGERSLERIVTKKGNARWNIATIYVSMQQELLFQVILSNIFTVHKQEVYDYS